MDENIEEVIYYHKGIDFTNSFTKWFNLILGFVFCMANGLLATIVIIAILSFVIKIQVWIFPFIWIPVGGYIFYKFLKSTRESKSSYKILDDRIEFFNESYPLEKDIIDLDEIDQVRYEDDFGKSYSSSIPSSSFIYCYFKDGYKSKSNQIKKDRLMFVVGRNEEGRKSVIRILTFFQQKKKQVYISTKHEEINTALNFKNWTDPGIHPSIRI